MIPALDRISQVIRDNELDTLVVYTADGRDKLDQVSDNDPEQLCTALILANESYVGPLRVEGSKLLPTDGRRRAGRPTVTERPFVWTLPGQPKNAPAPIGSPAPPASREVVKVPDLEVVRESESHRADAAIKQARIEQLEAEKSALENELDELNDEAERAAEVMAAPPAPGPVPFWHDEKKILEVLDRAVDLFGKLRGQSTPKDQPTVPPTADLSERERRLIEGFRNFAAKSPDEAHKASTFILNFAHNAPPADQ